MSFFLRVLLAIVVALLLTPVRVSAQEPGIPVPLADVSAGYVFMHDFTDIEAAANTNFPAGWYFSGAVNPTTWIGIVGEVSGSYKNNMRMDAFMLNASTDVQIYTFMGGGRFFKKVGRVVPFAQMLAGVAHLRAKTHLTPSMPEIDDTFKGSATDFALQPGGGVTIYLTNRVGVRLAGDYRTIIDFAAGDNGYTHELRMIAGFTMQWGGR